MRKAKMVKILEDLLKEKKTVAWSVSKPHSFEWSINRKNVATSKDSAKDTIKVFYNMTEERFNRLEKSGQIVFYSIYEELQKLKEIEPNYKQHKLL